MSETLQGIRLDILSRGLFSEPRSPKGKNILVFFVDKMSHRDE